MNRDLTKGSVTKSMLLFAIPMILGDLLQQFYNIADTLIAGGYKNDLRSLEILVNEGPEDVLRLVKEMGVDFDQDSAHRISMTLEGGHSRRRILHHKDSTGREITEKLLAAVQALPNVPLLENTQLCSLTPEEGGFWAGLLTPEGWRSLTCSYCILCTGGIGRVYPYTTNSAIATGDGITLCAQLGADIDYVNARAAMLGPMRHPFGTTSLAAGMSRYGIQVNRRGEPFLQDCMGEAISPLVHQPGRMVYQIIDRAGAERTMKESAGRPCDVPGADMNPFYQNWEAELEQERQWGVLFSAPTLEALGEQIHIPADRLRQAVDLYNQRAGQPETRIGPNGPEELPPKPPMESGPWYAIPLKLFHENAIGGMVIDENAQVLRLGRPIPGLYAAGDNTRGVMLPGRIGADYIERTISALTFALCSGYIAGEMCGKQQMQQGGIL